jgi:hypothetical protein
MLKVTIHSGLLDERCRENQLAVLDIAYAKRGALADYLVALSLKGAGQLSPTYVREYPRWSASLWDLVARALAQALYHADQIPPTERVDRRCAYATKLCASIERQTRRESGVELGTAEILQNGKRGIYTATLTADIHGTTKAEFEYGCKALNPAELLMRAICWALYRQDTLGARPGLIIPPMLRMEGVERFHLDALPEPARTGFKRYLATAVRVDPPALHNLPRADEYVAFLYS